MLIVLAVLVLLIAAYVLFGVILRGSQDEPTATNQPTVVETQEATQGSTAQEAPESSDPVAPEAENRDVDAYAAYEPKDPFRQLLESAEADTGGSTTGTTTVDEPGEGGNTTSNGDDTPNGGGASGGGGGNGGGDGNGNGGGTGGSGGGLEDSDNDGLSDRREQALGTDPNDRDTDGDGTPDGRDDANGDGLPDSGGAGADNGAGNGKLFRDDGSLRYGGK